MKFILKNNIVLLFLIIICNKSFAGKGDSLLGYFEDLKSRTLLVCLQTENTKSIEKLTDKENSGKLELYRKGIKSTNANLIASVKLCWKLNSSIKFIPIDSLEWFKTNFPKKYGYLILSSAQVHSGGAVNAGVENIQGFSNLGLHLFLCDKNQSIGYCNFPNDEVGQDVAKDVKQNNVLYSDYYVSSTKFIYALYRIDYLYNDLTKGIRPWFGSRNAINSGTIRGEKAGELKNKTLVARVQDCEKNLDMEKVKKYYPYNFKIVSDEEFEKYLLNKDPGIACVFVSLVSGNTMGGGGASRTKLIYMEQAVNANDGTVSVASGGPFALNYKVLEKYTDMVEKAEKEKK